MDKRNYVVFAWLPVNVRVKASSKAKACELALEVLEPRGKSFNLSDEDSGGIWLDSVPAKIDEKQRPMIGTQRQDVELAHEEEDAPAPELAKRRARLPAVPKSWSVQPLKPGQAAEDRAECGTCGRAWDDGKVTSITPAPAGRCPFESWHKNA